jgi:fatty acid desaturase
VEELVWALGEAHPDVLSLNTGASQEEMTKAFKIMKDTSAEIHSWTESNILAKVEDVRALKSRVEVLNNNLHIAHHAEPHVPWYEVPKLARRVNAVERAREAGLLYEGGYAEVFRKFSFKPMGAPLREGA